MFVRRRNLNQILIDKRHFNAKVWILLEVTSVLLLIWTKSVQLVICIEVTFYKIHTIATIDDSLSLYLNRCHYPLITYPRWDLAVTEVLLDI